MKSVLKLIAITILLVSAAFIPARTNAQFFVMENPLLNEKAPDFTLNNMKGEKVNFAQYRDHKPTILFFWATWCPHCRQELKELNKAKNEILQKGIKILLVDVGEDAAQVNKYVAKNNLTFDIVLDADQEIGEKYGLIGVPTFFFVNQDGVVKAVEHVLPKKFEDIF